jgi:hypothetical protein
MDAKAALKHHVRYEQTSGEKNSPSKGVLIYYFFPAHMQIFRLIGHTFGSQRERVNSGRDGFMWKSWAKMSKFIPLSLRLSGIEFSLV